MADTPRNWTCPHCGRDQTATGADFSSDYFDFQMTKTALGDLSVEGAALCCANQKCRKPTVHLTVGNRVFHSSINRWIITDNILFDRRVFPESTAMPQPEFIPRALRQDYLEACQIRELSPKASATLARRCLQGMIRDFCGISQSRLVDEIAELRRRVGKGNAPKNVSEESVEAIDAVRKIGNIGAHMEKDIDVIIDVDPEEAQVLIELIETLFEEWYVERDKRKTRFKSIHEIAGDKENQKKIAKGRTDLAGEAKDD